MNTRLLISALLASGISIANAQPAADQAIMLASASPEINLLPVPRDLQRHTEKVAEFRLQEISLELSEHIDEEIRTRLAESFEIVERDPS